MNFKGELMMLSIIVPVYNVEAYLVRCIDSLLKQSYKNIEIILVDDGSTDNSGKICDEYAIKYSQIKVVHQKNGGPSKARNTGISIATGEYIAFADSDDWVEHNFYKNLMENAIEHDADMVKCGFAYVDGDKKEYEIPKNTGVFNNGILENFFNGILWIVVWNAVYKAKIVKSVIYPEGLNFEDNYASFFYLYYSKKVVVISDAEYNYFNNSNSIMTKIGSEKKLKLTEYLRNEINRLNIVLNDDIRKKMDFVWAKDWYHYIRDNNNVLDVEEDILRDIYRFIDMRRAIMLYFIILKRRLLNG